MSALAPFPAPSLPALVGVADTRAQIRFLEFFAAATRNPQPRRAYWRTAVDCLVRDERRALDRGGAAAACGELDRAADAGAIGASREAAPGRYPPPVRLAGHGQVAPTNPAASVRRPAHRVRKGKTPVLDPVEARQLLDSIDVSSPSGLETGR